MKIKFESLEIPKYRRRILFVRYLTVKNVLIQTSKSIRIILWYNVCRRWNWYRNHMSIDKIALLHNLNKVQVSNQLPPSNSFIGTNTKFPQVNIEMETGTGKTFVYLKTIYELNKQYGFKKIHNCSSKCGYKKRCN